MLVTALAAPPAAAQLPTGGFDGDPATTTRVLTADPADAAVELSQARFPAAGTAEHVVLGRDDAFADSLAGTPLSATGPLLFTATAALTPATAEEVRRVLPAGGLVYLLGGTVAISQAVEDQLTGNGFEVLRLSGPDRVSTSVAIATEVRRLNPGGTTVALARGFGPPDNPTAAWADSATAGAWAAAEQVPVLITASDVLSDPVATFLADDPPAETILLGGEAALSTAVAAAVPNPRRIAGSDRAATAVAIATDLVGFAASGPRRVVVFNAFDELGWTRGLAAAGLAATAGAPLLAVNGDTVPPATEDLLFVSGQVPEIDMLAVGPAGEVGDAALARLDALDAGGGTPGGPPPPPPTGPLSAGPPVQVSVAADGTPANDNAHTASISGDGLAVAFTSGATNLDPAESDPDGDVFLQRQGRTTVLTPDVNQNAQTFHQSVSADGTRVLFLGDSRVINGMVQDGQAAGLFLADLSAGTTTRIDVPAMPFEDLRGSAALAGDGRHVALVSARPLTDDDGADDADLFLADTDAGTLIRLPVPETGHPGGISEVAIDGDGSHIAFTSFVGLVAEDTNGEQDIYLHVVATGQTVLVSHTPSGMAGERQSGDGGTVFTDKAASMDISDDGSTIAFFSFANDLVAGDEGDRDLFLYDVASGTVTKPITRVDEGFTQTFGDVESVALDATGSLVAFTCDGCTNIAEGQTSSGGEAAFVHDIGNARTIELTVPDPRPRDIDLSADGSAVVYESNDQIFRTPLSRSG